MTYLVPFFFPLPVTALVTGAAEIDVHQALDLTRVAGNLQALISGTFSVEVRRSNDGTLLGTLSWTGAGAATPVDLNRLRVSPGDKIRFDVTSLGVGAVGCYVTLWAETA